MDDFTPEQAAQFEADFEKRLLTHKCSKCGGSKLTQYVRGKPYMPWVEWSYKKSAEVGWKIINLGGCTTPGEDVCVDCTK